MSDWAVLDRSDPAPGDPDGTRNLGERLLREAQLTGDSTSRLNTLASGSGDLRMAGDYAAGFSETLQSLPVELAKLGRAYRGCGSALTEYAGTLAEAKTLAGSALREGIEADIRYRAAVRETQNLLPGPQSALLGSGLSLNEMTITLATTGLDEVTREQVRAAARRARTADADLDRARGLADQAAALREQGEDRCVKGINDALSDSGIKNKAWYQKAWDFVSTPFRSWDEFISLCGKVALIAGTAALFISGPIGWALMATALLTGAGLFANDLNKFARGQIGVGGLALGAIGLIPGGRGVVSVARLGRETKLLTQALTSPGGVRLLAGARRTGAGVLGGQVRNVGSALPFTLDSSRGIRGAIQDPRLFARAFQSRFLGRDPIDLATGEMVMQMTDFELPGLLPLVLERTYSSKYGVGRWFGPSWSSLLDQRLEVDAHGICFAYTEAILLSYPPLAPGESALPEEGPRLRLTRAENGGYTVHDPKTRRTMSFAAPEQASLDQPPSDHSPVDKLGVVLPLAGIGDDHGHRIDLGYDDDGALVEIQHSGGYLVEVDTRDGLINGFRLRGRSGDADTSIVQYTYDGRGRLTEVINSSGLPLRFAYDSQNRITGWVDRIGTWYRYTYDQVGRVIRTSGSAHCLDGEIRYDSENRVTGEMNSLGAETIRHFNQAWQVERVIDPLGHETVHEWDRYDRKLSETDPLGNTIRYAYDRDGNLTEVTRPDGLRTRAEYNSLHCPTLITQPDGGQWRQDFDEHGDLVAVTDPAGATTRYQYDQHGALTSISDALGHTTRVRCDAACLPIAVTDPLGATTTAQRDGFGRVTTLVDPLGNTTRCEWTVEGKLATQILPDGTAQTWRYDGEGTLIEHIDALGQSTRIEPTYFDLPAVRTQADGSQVVFNYDTELRLSAATDANGQIWRYEYDLAGRLVREIDYDGRVLAYAHDKAGRLTTRVNGAGEVVKFEHDQLGNVIARETDSGRTTLTYDTAGRLIRALSPDAEIEFERDRLGRVIAETTNGRTLASSYDTTGRRVARRTPTGRESRWEHDAAGRPITLQTAGRTLQFEHDDAGREIARHFSREGRRRFGSMATLTHTWDTASRLLSQTVLCGPASARPLQERTFSYRADGYITGIDDRLTGSRSYDLNALGQVSAVTGAGWSEQYAYDQTGNIVDAFWPADPGPDFEGLNDVRAIGSRDFTGSRVRRAGSVHYDYDPQGRVTRRRQKLLSGGSHTWQYTWDADDRLTGAITPDNTRWRYRYDALGRRIAKQRLDLNDQVIEQVDFSWDGVLLAEQTITRPSEPTQALTWDWEPQGFRPLIQHRRSAVADAPQAWVDQQFYAIITDLVGTPTDLLTDTGEIIPQTRASLWAAAGAGSLCPLRFPGQYHDPETGFYYNFFRHYDPWSGAYTTSDPVGLAGALNPTQYSSNPLYWADPLGLSPYSPAYFRGARPGQAPSFAPRPNEYKVDSVTGTVRPTHGVSVFNNPTSVSSKGFVPHELDLSTVPKELQIVQRGKDPKHFEIMPREGTALMPSQYADLLGQISVKGGG